MHEECIDIQIELKTSGIYMKEEQAISYKY